MTIDLPTVSCTDTKNISNKIDKLDFISVKSSGASNNTVNR
jgi:hypothetical protein